MNRDCTSDVKATALPLPGLLARSVKERFTEAENELIAHFARNTWFVREYWPMNRARFQMMVEDACRLHPPGAGARLLDVGCANGCLSHLFARLCYDVTGTDGYPDPERDRLLESSEVAYWHANFNELYPLQSLPDDAFDVVVCGEVIEHILNHPLGFAKEMARVLRPGGHLILTTPNPSTLMNIVRMARDRYSPWGTRAFIDDPKIDGATIISRGDIHYREYTIGEVTALLERAGLTVISRQFIGSGANSLDGRIKRLLKRLPLAGWAMSRRLLASGQYQIAIKAS
jgi:SAM-dependent methyltransferase